jgi:hypothetical protein
MGRVIDWLSRFFRATATRLQVVALGLGILLAIGGALIGLDSFWGPFLVGLGTAFIAPPVFAFLYVARDEWVKELSAQGVREVFPDRHTHFKEGREWPWWVKRAEHHVKILGVANHGWIRTEPDKAETAAAFVAALQRPAVQIQICWLNPEVDMSALREEEEDRSTRSDTVASIRWFMDFRESLGEEMKDRIDLREYDAVPTCGITWIDDVVIATHYMNGRMNKFSPGIVVDCRRPFRSEEEMPPLARKYINNYEDIAKAQSTNSLTQARLGELEAAAAGWGGAGLRSEAEIPEETPDE